MALEFERHGIEVYKLNARKSITGFISSFYLLCQFMRERQFDLVHAHMFHSIIYAVGLKAFGLASRIVFTPHNTDLGTFRRHIIVAALRLFRNADIIFSIRDRRWFLKTQPVVVANGVPVVNIATARRLPERWQFLCVGNLKAAKNQMTVVDAAQRLIAQGFDFQINILGKGDYFATIQEEVISRGLEEYVFLRGSVEDVHQWYLRSDCLIQPSENEGMPLVILEAGMLELPVISTIGGYGSINFRPEYGIISPQDELAVSMANVMLSYEDMIAKASCFREYLIIEHDIDRQANLVFDIYSELCYD